MKAASLEGGAVKSQSRSSPRPAGYLRAQRREMGRGGGEALDPWQTDNASGAADERKTGGPWPWCLPVPVKG